MKSEDCGSGHGNFEYVPTILSGVTKGNQEKQLVWNKTRAPELVQDYWSFTHDTISI
jgi:hypothetical protein